MAEDSVTGVDGTLEPAPPPLLSDPLSGLVTGANLPLQRREEFEVVVPRAPSPDDLREAVEAALAEEQPPPPQAPEPVPSAADVTPGIMRPIRQWPAAAAVARTLRATRERIQAPAVRRPAGMRSGMTVVIVIVLVTVVILYFVITSLADTFSQLFG